MAKLRIAHHAATRRIHALERGFDFARCDHGLDCNGDGAPLKPPALVEPADLFPNDRKRLCRRQGCRQAFEDAGLL